MRVLFSNKTDEAKLVIEEDRQRQNNERYSIIGGYTTNFVVIGADQDRLPRGYILCPGKDMSLTCATSTLRAWPTLGRS